MRKRILAAALLAAFAASPQSFAADWRDEIFAQKDEVRQEWREVAEAGEEAQRRGVPVLFVVYSPECPVCKEFFRTVGERGLLAEIARYVVPVRLREREFIAMAGPAAAPRQVPAFYLVTPSGEPVVEPFFGAPADAGEFVAYLKRVSAAYRRAVEKSGNAAHNF